MTSAINYNDIDGTYPIAGQDNSSQGFRDNFTNIKNNFQSAYDEITDLQNKVLLKSPLNNGTFSNDMQGNVITNATLQGFRELKYNAGSVTGAVVIDFNAGVFQTLSLAGSTSLTFSNFTGTSGNYAKVKLQVTVTNTAYTLTFPSSVTIGTSTIGGMSGQTLTFDNVGIYLFELGTIDGGTSFIIQDLLRNKDTVEGGSLAITANINGSLVNGISMTVANLAGIVTGNITATNFIGNIINSGSTSATYTGNVQANYLIGNTGIQGTLITASQPNVTLLGTLTALSVTGNANVGNLTVSHTTDLCAAVSQTGINFVASAANAGSNVIVDTASVCIVDPVSSPIATYTITMPSNPVNGQVVKIGFGGTITTLSHSGGSKTLKGPLTGEANANVAGSWIYHTTTSTWYRIS